MQRADARDDCVDLRWLDAMLVQQVQEGVVGRRTAKCEWQRWHRLLGGIDLVSCLVDVLVLTQVSMLAHLVILQRHLFVVFVFFVEALAQSELGAHRTWL